MVKKRTVGYENNGKTTGPYTDIWAFNLFHDTNRLVTHHEAYLPEKEILWSMITIILYRTIRLSYMSEIELVFKVCVFIKIMKKNLTWVVIINEYTCILNIWT